MGCGGLVVKRIGCAHDPKRRCPDEVLGLQQPIDTGLGDEVPALIGERHRQLPGAELRALQGQLNDLLADDFRGVLPRFHGRFENV